MEHEMIKKLIYSCLIYTILIFVNLASVEAKSLKKKDRHKTYRKYKISTYKRKSRHFKRGNGPDLKSITIQSPYTEELNNGVNAIETTEPTL